MPRKVKGTTKRVAKAPDVVAPLTPSAKAAIVGSLEDQVRAVLGSNTAPDDVRLLVHLLSEVVDAPTLTDEEAIATFDQVTSHATTLIEARSEGATPEPDEVRDTLIKISRGALALVRAFDGRRRDADAREMHQGEAHA
jgi:hypothetical protein